MSNPQSYDFPLGNTLYAGVPFIWERRVRPHPATATAGNFGAVIWWNLTAQSAKFNGDSDLCVADSTPWLPQAKENVVVWGVHVYDTSGSKKIQVKMIPKLKNASPYTFTYGSFMVYPTPGSVVVAQQWAAFWAGVERLRASMNAPFRNWFEKWKNEMGKLF